MRVLVQLEHGIDTRRVRKFVEEQMKKKGIAGKITEIKKNNWMSFTHDSGDYFFDVDIETTGGGRSAPS